MREPFNVNGFGVILNLEFGRPLSVPTMTCFIVNAPSFVFCSVLFCKEVSFVVIVDFSGDIALSIDECGRNGMTEVVLLLS